MNRRLLPVDKLRELDLCDKGKVRGYLQGKILKHLKQEVERVLRYWARDVKERLGCQRNGYYQRGLISEFGDLGKITVPRFRKSPGVENPVFPKSSRYCHGFLDKVVELFCHGLSTWAIAEFFDGLTTSMTVSRRVGEYLLRRVKAFENRRIEKTPIVLVVDGIWLKLKERGKCVLLCAVGIDSDGFEEMLHFGLYPNEGPKSWRSFFDKLIAKGLDPSKVALVVSDCVKWLKGIIGERLPQAKWQRCIFHLIMDAGEKVKNLLQRRKFRKALGWMFKAPSLHVFWIRLRKIKRRWQHAEPEALRILDNGLDDSIVFFDFPRHLWTKIRTTNAVESTFAHVRRRIRWMGAFKNTKSAINMTTMPIVPHYTK